MDEKEKIEYLESRNKIVGKELDKLKESDIGYETKYYFLGKLMILKKVGRKVWLKK